MVKQCGICLFKFVPNSEVSCHTFPKDEKQKQKWFGALNVYPFPTDYVYICSKHFTEDCFYTSPAGVKELWPDAIPTRSLQLPFFNPKQAERKDTKHFPETPNLKTYEKLPTNIQEKIEIVETQICIKEEICDNSDQPTQPQEETCPENNDVPLCITSEPTNRKIVKKKRDVQLDHPYADPVRRDYKKLYLETKEHLSLAIKKIRFLNQKMRRQKRRTARVTKFMRDLKRQSYKSASEVLNGSKDGDSAEKRIVPKKMIILL